MHVQCVILNLKKSLSYRYCDEFRCGTEIRMNLEDNPKDTQIHTIECIVKVYTYVHEMITKENIEVLKDSAASKNSSSDKNVY